MRIKIDSREQQPLDFTVGGAVSEIITTGLPFADYWSEWETGEEMPIAFERKSINDLFGTLTSGMERFKKEIQRATENNFKMILIVEGTMTEVLNGTKYSTKEGKSILKTLFTLWVKYDVTPVFCPNRSEMKRFILETFEACGRSYKPTSGIKFPPTSI